MLNHGGFSFPHQVNKMKTLIPLLLSLSLSAHAVELKKPVQCQPTDAVHALVKEHKMKIVSMLKTDTGILAFYRVGDTVAIMEYFQEDPNLVCMVGIGELLDDKQGTGV
jgi:hypothetical protein